MVKPTTNPNPKATSSATILLQLAFAIIPSQIVPNAPIPSTNIPTVPSQPNKDFLAKPKPYTSNNSKKSYIQASKSNVKDIICIKNVFPSLLLKKIIEVNDLLSKSKSVKP